MRKISLIVVSLVLIGFVGGVLAQEVELSDPGLTPDSPFYFLEIISEGIGTFFTFGDLKKAERYAELAEERIAEVKAVVDKGKPEAAEKALKRYEDQLRKALARAERARIKGESIAEVTEVIAEGANKHVLVLEEVLDKVPEEAKEAVKKAKEVSMNEQKNALRALSTENPEKATEINLKAAEARLNRAKAKAEEGEIEEVEEALKEFEDQYKFGEEISQIAQGLGKDTTTVEQLVGEATSIHLEVLADVYEKVPEQAKPAIENAMEVSAKGHQKAVEALKEKDALGEIPEEIPMPDKVPEEVEEKIQEKIKEGKEKGKGKGEELPSVWTREGVLIPGGYCDPEVVKLPDGRYRMYYGLDPRTYPEVAIISAVSSGGLNWIPESGIRISGEAMPAMPSVIELPDGRWRMYYSSGGIQSAISDDGLNFQQEGLQLANYGDIVVRSSTVIRLDDGRYRMYYCEGKQQPTWPVQVKSAISSDGLSWEIEPGIRIDGSKSPFYGHIDGPDIVKLSDGSFRLYFWSGSPKQEKERTGGVYITDSVDGLNFSNITLIFGRFTDEEGRKILPADSSVVKIEEGWRMYCGSDYGIWSAIIANLLP